MKMLKSVVVLLAVTGMVLSGSPFSAVGGPANAGNCPDGWIEVTMGSETVCVYKAPNGSMNESYEQCMKTCTANQLIGSSIWYGAATVSLMFGPWGLVPGAIFGTIGYVTGDYGGSCEAGCAVPS